MTDERKCFACGKAGKLKLVGTKQVSAATGQLEPFVRCGFCNSVYSTPSPPAPPEGRHG